MKLQTKKNTEIIFDAVLHILQKYNTLVVKFKFEYVQLEVGYVHVTTDSNQRAIKMMTHSLLKKFPVYPSKLNYGDHLLEGNSKSSRVFCLIQLGRSESKLNCRSQTIFLEFLFGT